MKQTDQNETLDLCMSVIKSKYDPVDLSNLADLLERNSIDELSEWIASTEDKPLLLLHLINMIARIAQSHGQETEYIKRLLVIKCREEVDFISKVKEWENDNGGEGVYAKAISRKIGALMQDLNA